VIEYNLTTNGLHDRIASRSYLDGIFPPSRPMYHVSFKSIVILSILYGSYRNCCICVLAF